MSTPLWRPSAERCAAARLIEFTERLSTRGFGPFTDYAELHRWSIESKDEFWHAVLEYGEIAHSGDATRVRVGDDLPGAEWFPDVELNYAENLLRAPDESLAIIFEAERDEFRREISFGELRGLVARARAGFGKENAENAPNNAQQPTTNQQDETKNKRSTLTRTKR